MNHLNEALNCFEKRLIIGKELYEANPRSVSLLEGLGISHYKLAVIYKANGNDVSGEEQFLEWKNIISHLAENYSQVSKYGEWNKIEY